MDVTTEMNARLHSVSSDIGIPLETITSDVTVDDDGSIRINAMPLKTPSSNEERNLMQSALHVTILDAFINDVESPSKLHIQVIVPMCEPDASPNVCFPITSWIEDQRETINEFARTMAQIMVENAYTQVIRAYPWRNVETMIDRARRLVDNFRTNMNVTGAFDPVITSGNVDALLPAVQTLIDDHTYAVILRQVTSYLGRAPRSVLELYENVYSMRKTWCASRETMHLFTILFRIQ